MPLNRRSVGEIIHRGGTMLKTARSEEFKKEEAQRHAIAYLRSKNIDGLVVIGGDGSMRGAEALGKLGMPTITIPGTIDNDMAGTEYTIGFDTAVDTVLESVNRIRDTAFSHDRVAIIEVMGRHAGFIALNSGIACGAEMVLVPEREVSLQEVCKHLKISHKEGKTNSIIIVAEGAYSGSEVYEYLKNHTEDMNPSLTVLGYIQRGGAPTARDILMASLFAEKAVQSLVEGVENAIIGWMHCEVTATPYTEAHKYKFKINENMYKLVHILGH
jgi:6-phosphofructokinase 1